MLSLGAKNRDSPVFVSRNVPGSSLVKTVIL